MNSLGPGGNVTAEDKIRLRPDAAVWREIDGETILLDLTSSSYLGINASGSALWAAIVEGANAAALAQMLVQQFGVEASRATRDVEAFLATCRTHGLIE